MLVRSAFSILCLTLSSWSLAENIVKDYPVKDFSEFVASGETWVEISQSDQESLRIEADAEAMQFVKVDQSGNKVSVWAKKGGGFWDWFGNHESIKIKVTLQVKNLNYLELSGAAEAKVADLKSKSFYLNANGAANSHFNNLNAEELKVNLSGASNVDFQSINSQVQYFDLSGAANLDVKYASNTEKLRAGASGASNIRAQKLTAAVADINASGASHIDVSVTADLDAEASGASSINYYGKPKARTQATGASSVNAHP